MLFLSLESFFFSPSLPEGAAMFSISENGVIDAEIKEKKIRGEFSD